jgi:hypothetical protein
MMMVIFIVLKGRLKFEKCMFILTFKTKNDNDIKLFLNVFDG